MRVRGEGEVMGGVRGKGGVMNGGERQGWGDEWG